MATTQNELVGQLLDQVKTHGTVDFSPSVLRLVIKILRHETTSNCKLVCPNGWASAKRVTEVVDSEFRQNVNWPGFAADYLFELARKHTGRLESKNGSLRARYGHSIAGVLTGIVANPPSRLLHATHRALTETILEHGLTRQNRNFVHMTSEIEYALALHESHGTENQNVVLEICTEQLKGRQIFYQATEHVWQTSYVPSDSIRQCLS